MITTSRQRQLGARRAPASSGPPLVRRDLDRDIDDAVFNIDSATRDLIRALAASRRAAAYAREQGRG